MKNKINIAFKLLPVTLAVSMSMTSTVQADQVILDDLIVDGSICAGMDCVNGESFGFDTLRLKENNLRIRFVDTSASASFPSRDWQITANDSANGGLNKFSIDDIDGAKTPFTIEAGASNHALYVDDASRIGIGTNAPVVQVHVKDGNTPTLRLEQDGSSGFTPQVWDVAGNESNFFIRDATNGSTLPFRIFPGAPSDSISISADGDVGIGTKTPIGRFEIKDGSNSLFSVASDGKVGVGTNSPFENFEIQSSTNDGGILLDSSDGGIDIVSGNDHLSYIDFKGEQNVLLDYKGRIIYDDNSEKLKIYTGTNTSTPITIDRFGNILASAHNTPSDYRLKENIKITGNALSRVLSLPVYIYNYKNTPQKTNEGFLAHEVKKIFPSAATGKHDEKGINGTPIYQSVDYSKIVPILTAAIQELNKKIEHLEIKNKEKEKEVLENQF